MKINNCKCGGKPKYRETWYSYATIECQSCRKWYRGFSSAKVELIKKWNKKNRKTRKELKSEIKQLKAEVVELMRKCFLSL